jgi:hypothetical protein
MAAAAKDVHKEGFIKILNLGLVQIRMAKTLAYYIMARIMAIKSFTI